MIFGDKWLLFFVLIALALGLQLVFASKQALSFTRAIHQLRSRGRTAVGMGGGKWFGRRVFIAIAISEQDTVVEAIRLRGITQFARARPAPLYHGLSVAQLAGDSEFSWCGRTERAAARQAAETLSPAGGSHTASGAVEGKESSSA